MAAAAGSGEGPSSSPSRRQMYLQFSNPSRPTSDDEGASLLHKPEPDSLEYEIAERRLGMFFWILIIVGFSGFVAFFGWDREVVQIITRYFASKEATTTTDLYIQASSEYGVFSAPYPWLDDVPGSQIVELRKPTTLTLSGAFATGSSFSWKLSYPSEDEPTEWTGTSASQDIQIDTLGSYSVKVEAFDVKTGSFRGRYTTHLVARNVRREIRSLTAADRMRFTNAALYLWNTSTADGREMFGPDFTSVFTFADHYLSHSNHYHCDRYHDGSAWLTHHIALVNSFEASLQAVDPAVTLPYWDFTIEGQAITGEFGD